MARFFWWIILLCLVSFSPAWEQENTRPQLQTRPAGPEKVPPGGTDRQIILDVQVTDRTGAAVRGLLKQDFSLLDARRAQKILSFQAVDRATQSVKSATPAANGTTLSSSGGAAVPLVEIVLVVDAVNASFKDVAYGQEQIKRFLLQNGGKLAQPVSLMVVTDTGTKILEEGSRDGKAVAAVYDSYQTGLRFLNRRTQGFLAASECFDISLRAMANLAQHEQERPGRKLMMWISPGWPMLSGPDVDLTQQDQDALFNSIVDISSGLRQARVTLYSIDPLGTEDAGGTWIVFYKEFLKPVTSPSHALPGNLALQVFAEQSGGRVFNASNDVTTAIAQAAADAEVYYTLSFNAHSADEPDEYHTLQVKVDRPGIKIRTRVGYYAQP
jgi:VWFA-related protein